MKTKIFLFLSVLLCTSITAIGQVINLNVPQGTYCFTDKKGTKFKLVIKPKISEKSTPWRICGKAELTELGENQETYYGTWSKDTKYIASPSELNKMEISLSESCNLTFDPERNGGASRMIIGHDGWIYPDVFNWDAENPKYRLKLTKGTSTSTSQGRKSKRATTQRKKIIVS